MLFHDLHETLGRYHFQAHPSMTDAELESAQISRMWDLLASDEEYREAKEWIAGFTNQLDQSRAYSPREFLHLLGRELAEIASEDGVLTSAYKARVPIFCPAIADSGLAVGIAGGRFERTPSCSNHPGCAGHDECNVRTYLVSLISEVELPRASFNKRRSHRSCKKNTTTVISTQSRSLLTLLILRKI
jgi:hypothetical protein